MSSPVGRAEIYADIESTGQSFGKASTQQPEPPYFYSNSMFLAQPPVEDFPKEMDWKCKRVSVQQIALSIISFAVQKYQTALQFKMLTHSLRPRELAT